MSRFNSAKVVSVTPATLQGFQANYMHYSSARVNRGDPSARPLFLREPSPKMNGGGPADECQDGKDKGNSNSKRRPRKGKLPAAEAPKPPKAGQARLDKKTIDSGNYQNSETTTTAQDSQESNQDSTQDSQESQSSHSDSQEAPDAQENNEVPIKSWQQSMKGQRQEQQQQRKESNKKQQQQQKQHQNQLKQ